MSALVDEIATQLRAAVQESVTNLQGAQAELRCIFHGPPLDLLRQVFRRVEDSGGIVARLSNGEPLRFPVLLQVDEPGIVNPALGQSGPCDEDHLLTLRNSPGCPRYIALVPPGRNRSLSVASATTDIGVAPENNSGSASIDEWWSDDFIQRLVACALDRGFVGNSDRRHQALLLVGHAIREADEVDRQDPSRRGAWTILSRVFSLSSLSFSYGEALSQACGFPPTKDASIDAAQQVKVLHEVAETLVDEGFGQAVSRLRDRAPGPEIEAALDDFLEHLQEAGGARTEFARAPSHFYVPLRGDVVEAAPAWWKALTVEAWLDLLEADSAPRGAIQIECTNSLVPAARGINALVRGPVELSVMLPEGTTADLEVLVERQGGGAANRRRWKLQGGVPRATVIDDAPPPHPTPLRYSAEATGLRKATFRVISLEAWSPGVFVDCRTATKVSAPKKPRARPGSPDLEASLMLAGQGRHYLDLYTREGVELGAEAVMREQGGLGGAPDAFRLVKVSGFHHGVEINATAECEYDIALDKGNGPEVLRLQLTCDDSVAQGCRSEFEKLILLHRQLGKKRAVSEVQVDRQMRVADLQGWMLDPGHVAGSFQPLVLSTDYAINWRIPDWTSAAGTILSQARYVNDPRPSPSLMSPPAGFVDARVKLAARIRGEDGSGLVEGAPLGQWMLDPAFEELVGQYLDAYFRWLEADPDCAPWADLVVVASLEAEGRTLVQEPDAVLASPLHPIRLAWHCLAQRALHVAYQDRPCPAASILDPDCSPDAIALPLWTASGAIKRQPFISVECSSDFWGVLWNGSRLSGLAARTDRAPFDSEFGLEVGGVSSGFSVAQVKRALQDVNELLAAKPVLNVAVSSAAGRNNACNDGILSWCRSMYADGDGDPESAGALGPRIVQVFDDRDAKYRPDDAAISNLAEDTGNRVRWFDRLRPGGRPDLGIIAQLEISSPTIEAVDHSSPLGFGALARHRIRRQLLGNGGAFLSESRTGSCGAPTGDGLADKLARTIAWIEGYGIPRSGYQFAPSVHAIGRMLGEKDYNAEFAAVSSTAVDPSCFLGGWLEGAYLWDYELPSYSQRAGDTNGYYLLSRIRDVDKEALRQVLKVLPGVQDIEPGRVEEVIFEVARRGIPTVRGISQGSSRASGDLGLFLAARLLQDEFRATDLGGSLLPVLWQADGATHLALVIPVDPFRGYLDDLRHALDFPNSLRPDVVVATVSMTDSSLSLRLTPIEVKFRGTATMSPQACEEALEQARALSELLEAIRRQGEGADGLLWKLAFQHLILSMVGFGFRVYSQQSFVHTRSKEWTEYHQRTAAAILSEEADIQIDPVGRLIAFDASPASAPRDCDGDGWCETIAVAPADSTRILLGDAQALHAGIQAKVGSWKLLATQRNAGGAPARSMTDGTTKDYSTVNQAVATAALHEAVNEASAVAYIEPPGPREVGESNEDEANAKAGEHVPATPESQSDEEKPNTDRGVTLLVGTTVDGFEAQELWLDIGDTKLNQLNIGVVGDLGTGKTQLLKSLVLQIRRGAPDNQGLAPRFLIFDYKKDYSSKDFLAATGARVMMPRRIPLNLFDTSDAGESLTPWLDRFKFFSDVLDKIFSGIGPVQRQNLKQAVKRAYEEGAAAGHQPTIYDVHRQYQAQLKNKADAPLSIIDDLVDSEMFEADPSKIISFSEFLDGAVVVALNALGQDDRTKNMLVAIMLNMFYEYMLKIEKRPYRGTSPQLRTIDSFLLVDEADNIMRFEFDVLRKVLLQGREFGVGVILASQYLKHFKTGGGTDYREPLLTWFVHKVPNVTPQELGALGLTGEVTSLAERVKALQNHQCLYKTVGVDGRIIRGKPFFEFGA